MTRVVLFLVGADPKTHAGFEQFTEGLRNVRTVTARDEAEFWERLRQAVSAFTPGLVIFAWGQPVSFIRDVKGSAECSGIPLVACVPNVHDGQRETLVTALYDAGANCVICLSDRPEADLARLRSAVQFWIGSATLPPGISTLSAGM